MSDLHAAARSYLPRTLPLAGKRPLLPDWPNVVATRELVDEWWLRRWPRANVGVRTGGGLIALDVDRRAGGHEALAQLEDRHGKLPVTCEVATGGGGQHYYFRATGPVASVDLAPGLELKAEGRQVVAPPSVHPDTGRLYCWQPGRPFEPSAIAPLPAWLLPEAREVPRRATGPQGDRDSPLRAIPAARYVPELTGRPLDRRAYARCPFHGDGHERTPSLLAGGRDPALWHCFGCGAGGSIFDLAARLAGFALPLRGAAFVAVRDELREHYALDRQAAA